MKHSKDRVIALDYFRGICILMILFSHSSVFSGPFAYLSGQGSPWADAAGLFFLLSGITFGIVRGKYVESDFNLVIRKSFKRARDLYAVHIGAVLASIALAAFLISANLYNSIGGMPSWSGSSLLVRVLNLSYVTGLANFLMYYVVYLLLAPFALYALRRKYWPVVPVVSILAFVLNSSFTGHPMPSGSYTWFFIWQVYFFIGLTLARFRVPVISWFYGLKRSTVSAASWLIVGSSAALLAASVLLIHSSRFYPYVDRLVKAGLLPHQIRGGYGWLVSRLPVINPLVSDRAGILRPAVALLFLAAAYLLYQRFKQPLLRYTGNFVNTMGRDTLWIFVAQAFAIPLLAILPIRSKGLAVNIMMTVTLVYLMWLLTQRKAIKRAVTGYMKEVMGVSLKDKVPVLFQPLNLNFRSTSLDEE